MKKFIMLLVILCILLAGCSKQSGMNTNEISSKIDKEESNESELAGCVCEHEWIEADCTKAKECKICAVTEGEPLGHSVLSATCDKGNICKRCGELLGDALGHNWEEATYQTPKTCTRCGATDGEVRNIFEENGIPSFGESIYESGFFANYYTVEEYIDLYKVAESLSAVPKIAIDNSLFIAKQHFATYNTTEDKYVLMDPQGAVIRDYGDNGWVADYTRFKKMGKYSFVPILGNPATFEILDETGDLVAEYTPGKDNYYIEYVCELEQEYHVFAICVNGSYALRLLSPLGEVYIIRWPHEGLPSYSILDFQNSLAEEKVVIGCVSEGLFYALYKHSYDETYAFYFDIFGNKIIDLSSDQTNYHVYQMGDFDKGYAKICFSGADRKNYSVIIDTEGQFVGAPVEEE